MNYFERVKARVENSINIGKAVIPSHHYIVYSKDDPNELRVYGSTNVVTFGDVRVPLTVEECEIIFKMVYTLKRQEEIEIENRVLSTL